MVTAAFRRLLAWGGVTVYISRPFHFGIVNHNLGRVEVRGIFEIIFANTYGLPESSSISI